MGSNVCPGRGPDCLKPAETGVGVSARIYDSNSLGDRAKEIRIHLETGPFQHSLIRKGV